MARPRRGAAPVRERPRAPARARRGATALILAATIAVALPAGAGAQGDSPFIFLSANNPGTGQSEARVTIRPPGANEWTDSIVAGNFPADITDFFSSHPATCRHFNAEAFQPVLGCEHTRPLTVGGRLVLDLLLSSDCPADGSFFVQLDNKSTGASATASAPCVRSRGADLELRITPMTQRQIYRGDQEIRSVDDFIQAMVGGHVYVNIKAVNHGPETAPNPAISQVPGSRPVMGEQLPIEYDDLPPISALRYALAVPVHRPGEFVFSAIATSDVVDVGDEPEQDTFSRTFKVFPTSTIGSASPTEITGTARGGATATHLGILRSIDGGDIPRHGVLGGRSAAGCSWVRSRAVRFKRDRGRCDRPVWLRAKGKRRWSLTLSRRLPPGRYTLISSASDRRGAAETGFTRRGGNRRSFRVRP